MKDAKHFKESEMLLIKEWHPCTPRDVLSASEAYDLWLLNPDDDLVFFKIDWIHILNTDEHIPAGFSKFRFVYGQYSDFESFDVVLLFDELGTFPSQLQKDDVVIYWHRDDWS